MKDNRMIILPEKGTDEGAEIRVLLAECRGPSFIGYNLAIATQCMQLMDLVLWNRVDNPGPFLAKEATLLAVIKARGQFKGFEHYPDYSHLIVHNIQQLINIANNPKDKRHTDFAAFINTAADVASQLDRVPDPSKQGTLAAWRTAGSGSPGSGFTYVTTVWGTDFYSY
jgi:hypothetical protein